MPYSSSDINVVVECATRLVAIVNESLKIASESVNPDTKLSRLEVAKQKLAELNALAATYDFLSITSLAEVEALIDSLDVKFTQAGYADICAGNLCGEQLEKEGRIDEAITEYERLLVKGVDTPFTYRRLAILYKKLKRQDDELRVVRAALANISESNAQHYEWFSKRVFGLETKHL